MLKRLFCIVFIVLFDLFVASHAHAENEFINWLLGELENTFESVAPKIGGLQISGHDVVHDLVEKPLIWCEPLESWPQFQNRTPSPSIEDMRKEQCSVPNKELIGKLDSVGRVTGYTFVGTDKTPQQLENDNGIHYGNKGMDLQQFWDTCDGGCFGSTSRSPLIAARFASEHFYSKRHREGYIYVVLLQDAFADQVLTAKEEYCHLEDSNRDVICSRWFEQEISPYKGFNWKQVVAYRAVGEDGYLKGDIFFRKRFKYTDHNAYKLIEKALSLIEESNDNALPYEIKYMAKYYRIEAKHSGKYLDIKHQSKKDVAEIVQNASTESDSQKWMLLPAGQGYYYIKSKHSKKFLDVDDASTDDVIRIIQYQPRGTDNQKWLLRPDGNGGYFIMAKHSGKYLDIDEQSDQDGARAIQYKFLGSANQRWKLVPLH